MVVEGSKMTGSRFEGLARHGLKISKVWYLDGGFCETDDWTMF